jgi:hypothetical protein
MKVLGARVEWKVRRPLDMRGSGSGSTTREQRTGPWAVVVVMRPLAASLEANLAGTKTKHTARDLYRVDVGALRHGHGHEHAMSGRAAALFFLDADASMTSRLPSPPLDLVQHALRCTSARLSIFMPCTCSS